MSSTGDDSSSTIPQEMVYVINLDNRNYCGHEVHRAHKCGGHLASVLNTNESEMITQLLSDNGVTGDVWIGGNQKHEYRSDDSSNQERDPGAGWEWADGSCPWIPLWRVGQPDNEIRSSCSGMTCPTYHGEHNTIRKSDGTWVDNNGCFGDLAPKIPGVYILPVDYDDDSKYPSCYEIKGMFASITAGPVWRTPATLCPTAGLTVAPTSPTVGPTTRPTTHNPTEPTMLPTTTPTIAPTIAPTTGPTLKPTTEPTVGPTEPPTFSPSGNPSQLPTIDCPEYCLGQGNIFSTSSSLLETSPNEVVTVRASACTSEDFAGYIAGVVVAAIVLSLGSFFLGRWSVKRMNTKGTSSGPKELKQEDLNA